MVGKYIIILSLLLFFAKIKWSKESAQLQGTLLIFSLVHDPVLLSLTLQLLL